MSRKPKGTIPLIMALGEVLEAAHKIYEKGGSGGLPKTMLATELHNSPSSSTFNKKLGCLRQHGLAEEKADRIQLTPLGIAVVAPMPEDEGKSVREAFLRIPIYQFLHSRYAGKTLPLENDLTNVLIQERSLPRDLALEWTSKFYQGAKAANLLTQAAGKTVLLDKPHIMTGGGSGAPSEEEEGAKHPPGTSLPSSQPRRDLVVLQVPFSDNRHAEIRFSPNLGLEDFDVIIRMLEAYKPRGKS